MALSNWDTLAIGPDGKSVSGCEKFGETTFSIYKNWLKVEYKKVHLSVQFGEISVGDITIKSKRHDKQNSIFVLIRACDQELIEKEKPEYKRTYFAGIGCYGFGHIFEDYCKSKGVPYIPYDYSTSRNGEEFVGWYVGNGQEKLMKIDEGVDLNPWIGVDKETLDAFKAFVLESLELIGDDKYGLRKNEKAWFDSIDWDQSLRFNQGDAFFATAVGEEISGTKVQEATDPLLIRAIREDNDK